MIDFHTHILPNIDDGSKSFEESLELIKEAKEAGFEGIISTSHYIEGYYETTNADREKLLNSLKEKEDVELHIGSEVYLTEKIIDLLKEGKASTINNSCYVLFELPINEKMINYKDIVFKMVSTGFIPILAHPERYSFVQKDPNNVKELIELGVLMQCNFGSFIGMYGKKAEIIAKKMLENDMVHFLGSDVHRQNTIYKKIPNIINKIESLIGSEKLSKITEINPSFVLNNKKIDISDPKSIELSFFDTLKTRL